VLPGPSAVTAAMALSGVESLGFVFGGFLPVRPASARAAALVRLAEAAGELRLPLILFEAPHRIRELLRRLDRMVPSAQVALCRELTKRHEQVLVGTPADVAGTLREPRGEMTLVIAGLPVPAAPDLAPTASALNAAARRADLPDRTIVELLKAVGLNRRAAYALVQAPPGKPRRGSHAGEAVADKPRLRGG